MSLILGLACLIVFCLLSLAVVIGVLGGVAGALDERQMNKLRAWIERKANRP